MPCLDEDRYTAYLRKGASTKACAVSKETGYQANNAGNRGAPAAMSQDPATLHSLRILRNVELAKYKHLKIRETRGIRTAMVAIIQFHEFSIFMSERNA